MCDRWNPTAWYEQGAFVVCKDAATARAEADQYAVSGRARLSFERVIRAEWPAAPVGWTDGMRKHVEAVRQAIQADPDLEFDLVITFEAGSANVTDIRSITESAGPLAVVGNDSDLRRQLRIFLFGTEDDLWIVLGDLCKDKGSPWGIAGNPLYARLPIRAA